MASRDDSVRPWSCATLADGVDTLLNQSRVQDEQELQLQELIKDFDFQSSMVQLCHPVFHSVSIMAPFEHYPHCAGNGKQVGEFHGDTQRARVLFACS